MLHVDRKSAEKIKQKKTKEEKVLCEATYRFWNIEDRRQKACSGSECGGRGHLALPPSDEAPRPGQV